MTMSIELDFGDDYLLVSSDTPKDLIQVHFKKTSPPAFKTTNGPISEILLE